MGEALKLGDKRATAVVASYAVQLTLVVNGVLAGATPFACFDSLFHALAASLPHTLVADRMPHAWLAAQQRPEQVEAQA